MSNFFSIQISGEDIPRCWNCVVRQANYTCKLQENLEDMELKLGRLIKLRDYVEANVDLADAEQQPLKKQVEGWLSRVEKVIAEANQLIQAAPQQKEKLLLAGCFSKNCWSTYKFGKAVVQNLENLVSLQDKGYFKAVAERVPAAAQINLRPIESTVGLESTFAQVWNCIKQEQSDRIIGIYGMGGAGKTTLLSVIHNQLSTMQNGFDIVIWVTVSDLSTEKVQEEIWKKIGFSSNEFESKTLEERADCISIVLWKTKFVLLLDDIGEHIDLFKVGIHFLGLGNGSKLIFTTRSLDVCSQMTEQMTMKNRMMIKVPVTMMNDQMMITEDEMMMEMDQMRMIIAVNCLASTETRELFVKNVGEETLASHPDIPNLAEQLMQKCEGLPLALITIGRAMACKKTPEEWKYAIDVLRILRSRYDFSEMIPAAAQMILRPIKSTVGLGPEFAFVWSCLGKEDEGIIAIWGEGGIGKTHLLTQIHSTTQNGFHIVIWVTVSRDLRIEKVQRDIGEKIGFSSDEFENKTLYERAGCIFSVLNKKKFLLLLDDLWERIDLIQVGIPFPIEENGSKLIFTTRFLDVCGQMTAQKKIELCCLSPKEAWELFVKNVGEETLASHPDIPELAKKVIDECRGLPLAIITFGRAMACKKTPEAWKDAIKFLSRPVSPGTETMKLFDVILKFNYDSLPDNKFRSCFLYCCLFPEDFKIKIDDLIDCWIGEGFVEEYHVDFPRATRNRGLHIIDWLRSASLLEGNEEYVKMHDLIRNIGLSIASELEEEKCLVEAGAKLVQIPKVEAWNKVKRLSLMDNEIEFLEGTGVPPTCSNVLSLFLRKNRLKMICSEFFQCMPNLTVLDLSENTNIWEVPVGISELVSLEYLNLSSTNITVLPVELKSLKKLKCLNLDHIANLKTVPEEVIASFKKLQMFRMFKSGYLIDKVNECLVLEELKLLKHLNTLTITIKTTAAFQRFLSSDNLQSRTECMSFFHFADYKTLNVASLARMERLREICFSRLIWLEELKIERTIMNASKTSFSDLCRVHIHECHELRELTWLFVAQNLKHLVVKGCEKLEEIISNKKLSQHPRQGVLRNPNPLFTQLEQLDLIDLCQLNSIYWHALPFPRLIGLDVRSCPMLQRLPLNSESAKNKTMTIKGEKEWWDKLVWEDEGTCNSFLQSFVSYD